MKHRILSHEAIVDRCERADKMNGVQRKKSDPILDIADKKRQEKGEIHIAEQQGHRDRDDNLHTRPKVDEPSFGNKGKHVANKEHNNHDDAEYNFVRGGGTEYEIKREDVKDNPHIRTKSRVFVKNMIPLLHGRPPFILCLCKFIITDLNVLAGLFSIFKLACLRIGLLQCSDCRSSRA